MKQMSDKEFVESVIMQRMELYSLTKLNAVLSCYESNNVV